MKLTDLLQKYEMNKHNMENKLNKKGIKNVDDLHCLKMEEIEDKFGDDNNIKESIIILKEYLNKYDNELIEALKLSHCYELLKRNMETREKDDNDDDKDKGQLKKCKNVLNIGVDENGSNFSVGERQLICLSRAIIRKSKILLLDEATSSVDAETDKLIQETIRNVFKDNTILTIAHRIDTILDYDKILIMDKGNVLEYDKPKSLLDNKQSKFYQIIQESFGIDMEHIQKYNNKNDNNNHRK